jgi:hypothetical protein
MTAKTPTIANLYLAFRQAKSALFFEKRGVGLIDLAAYENNLPRNLKALQAKLTGARWFDKLELGEVWVVPKRFHENTSSSDGFIGIGATHEESAKRPIDVQLRITPHPDFAIAEVLYLWRFGNLLEKLLSNDVLGYRLDIRQNELLPYRRWLFEYWPKRYQQFRTAPLIAAKLNLEQQKQTLIISGDLANFYDTIDPSFLLARPLISELREAGANGDLLAEYKHATSSLLRAYYRFHRLASTRAATKIGIGIPIGTLTSRIVANLSLAPLDRHIASRRRVICYRRYVDDLVIVCDGDDDPSLTSAIRRFFPLASGHENAGEGFLRLDVNALDRPGSEFQLQNRKIRAHRLFGISGVDFIDAVSSDFKKTLSERRAFVDSSTLIGDGVSHLIRAGNTQGSPLRVLREADRARLERFSLSTSLRSLERVSSLIDHNEARDLVRNCLERVGRVLDTEDNWVDDFDVALRLLKLSISTGDWKSAAEFRKRMDRVWGSVEKLKARTGKLYYRGQEINPSRAAPWKWLRNYLHERRLEAICSCLPIGMDARSIATRFPGGLTVRTREVKATVLRRRAEQLALADLRSRDREDDSLPKRLDAHSDLRWLLKELSADEDLSSRMEVIDEYVSRCNDLEDRSWAMPAARLFLCTRPPSYFDIARRWLIRVEEQGFDDSTFTKLIKIVNAIRGTKYADTVGIALDRNTISIENPQRSLNFTGANSPTEPRIILGNLVVEDSAWKGAATRTNGQPYGRPQLTKHRLQGLTDVLEKAASASRSSAVEILVLPELSLPRKWFRTVANHVVKSGHYGLIVGLEYIHHRAKPFVYNQVYAVLPGPFMSVATWPWTKKLPAREEANLLSKLRNPVSFSPPESSSQSRTVIHSSWGSFSVLICSELIEARRVADLLGRAQLILCPAWNPDTASYDHLIQSVGFQLHAIIAIANNGHYSDCRAWAPRTERWERDLCRLIERDANEIVYFDAPLSSLIAFHHGDKQATDKFASLRSAITQRDLPKARRELDKLTESLQGVWRPLPPDWNDQ